MQTDTLISVTKTVNCEKTFVYQSFDIADILRKSSYSAIQPLHYQGPEID